MRRLKFISSIVVALLIITYMPAGVIAESLALKDSILDSAGLTLADVPERNHGDYVNMQEYVQTQILTYNGYQYAAYYNGDHHVCVARRKLPDGPWEYAELS